MSSKALPRRIFLKQVGYQSLSPEEGAFTAALVRMRSSAPRSSTTSRP